MKHVPIGVGNCLSSQTQFLFVTLSPREKLKGELFLSAVLAEVIPGLGRLSRAAFSRCQQVSAKFLSFYYSSSSIL